MLNLPLQEDSKALQNKKVIDQISISRDSRGVKHHREHQGMKTPITIIIIIFGSLPIYLEDKFDKNI